MHHLNGHLLGWLLQILCKKKVDKTLLLMIYIFPPFKYQYFCFVYYNLIFKDENFIFCMFIQSLHVLNDFNGSAPSFAVGLGFGSSFGFPWPWPDLNLGSTDSPDNASSSEWISSVLFQQQQKTEIKWMALCLFAHYTKKWAYIIHIKL